MLCTLEVKILYYLPNTEIAWVASKMTHTKPIQTSISFARAFG